VATNLNIDEALLAEVLLLSGKKTKLEAVHEALAEYIQKRKQKQILELFGKLDFDPKYDYKKIRKLH
jgi:Arc/MetJ family transcription regulator